MILIIWTPVYSQHTSPILGLSVDDEGEHVASCAQDGKVRMLKSSSSSFPSQALSPVRVFVHIHIIATQTCTFQTSSPPGVLAALVLHFHSPSYVCIEWRCTLAAPFLQLLPFSSFKNVPSSFLYPFSFKHCPPRPQPLPSSLLPPFLQVVISGLLTSKNNIVLQFGTAVQVGAP